MIVRLAFCFICVCGTSLALAETTSPTPAPISDENQSEEHSARNLASSALGENSAAQSSTPSLPTSASASPDKRRPADMNTIRLSMAESAFELDPSLENRGTLILAREKIVENVCMPQLNITLSHLGLQSLPTPQREACIKELSALFALDSSTPIGFCARDGIDSPNCKNAYNNQSTGSFGGGYRAPHVPEPLRPGMKPSIQDQTAFLYHDLLQKLSFLRDHEAIETRIAARDLFHRLLQLNCAVVRLALRELPPQDQVAMMNRNALLSQPLSAGIPIEKYVDVLVQGARASSSASAMAENAAAVAPSFLRLRLTSDACTFYISEGLRFEPTLATALCHRNGASSPSCIDALRAERSSTALAIQKARQAKGLPPVPSPAPGGKKAPGFSTF